MAVVVINRDGRESKFPAAANFDVENEVLSLFDQEGHRVAVFNPPAWSQAFVESVKDKSKNQQVTSRAFKTFTNGLKALGVQTALSSEEPDYHVVARAYPSDGELNSADFYTNSVQPLVEEVAKKVFAYAEGSPVHFQAPALPRVGNLDGGTETDGKIGLSWHIDYDFEVSRDRLLVHTYVGHATGLTPEQKASRAALDVRAAEHSLRVARENLESARKDMMDAQDKARKDLDSAAQKLSPNAQSHINVHVTDPQEFKKRADLMDEVLRIPKDR